jgi:hypothetical protein
VLGAVKSSAIPSNLTFLMKLALSAADWALFKNLIYEEISETARSRGMAYRRASVEKLATGIDSPVHANLII